MTGTIYTLADVTLRLIVDYIATTCMHVSYCLHDSLSLSVLSLLLRYTWRCCARRLHLEMRDASSKSGTHKSLYSFWLDGLPMLWCTMSAVYVPATYIHIDHARTTMASVLFIFVFCYLCGMRSGELKYTHTHKDKHTYADTRDRESAHLHLFVYSDISC